MLRVHLVAERSKEEHDMSGGSRTTISEQRSEPWEIQIPYLEAGFEQAADIYKRGTPKFYSGPTVAGFDPSQEMAQTATLGYGMGPRPAAQQKAAEQAFVQGAGGQVNTAVFNPMMDVLGRQMKSQLEKQVLPGIRSKLVDYQEGGSSVGDNIQSQAIAAANQQMLDKAAQMYGGAYSEAQQRVPQMLSQYGSIMSAPLGMYQAMSDVGAQRRAMSQAGIDADMARYQYEAQAPQTALQQYIAAISGAYGGSTAGQQTTPGPSGMQTLGQIAGIVGAFV